MSAHYAPYALSQIHNAHVVVVGVAGRAEFCAYARIETKRGQEVRSIFYKTCMYFMSVYVIIYMYMRHLVAVSYFQFRLHNILPKSFTSALTGLI